MLGTLLRFFCIRCYIYGTVKSSNSRLTPSFKLRVKFTTLHMVNLIRTANISSCHLYMGELKHYGPVPSYDKSRIPTHLGYYR